MANYTGILWSVAWDSLDGASQSTVAWDAMNPATGAPAAADAWGLRVRTISFLDVGTPFGGAYSLGSARGFGDGVGGVVSAPSGWGVGPDQDTLPLDTHSVPMDDLYIFNTQLGLNDPFPASGAFVLTIFGADMTNYNAGTYAENPNVTITVSTEAERTDEILTPEPATGMLIGFGGALLALDWRRRRRAARPTVQ